MFTGSNSNQRRIVLVVSQRFQQIFDAAGIVVSVLCAIHCFLLPVAAIALPWIGDTHGHGTLFVVSACIAGISLISGYRKHGEWPILLTGMIGVVALSFAHSSLLALAGSSMLVAGHVLNYFACRQLECGCHK
jgi:hypothetical protein